LHAEYRVIRACEPLDGAQSCDMQFIAARATDRYPDVGFVSAPPLSRVSREINPYKFVRDHRFGFIGSLASIAIRLLDTNRQSRKAANA
jgi:hypothetical protein